MRQREIWIVNLDPTVGSEFKKKRPAVIINGDDIGKLPLKIIAPITDFKPHYISFIFRYEEQTQSKRIKKSK